jgi:hypothetical protein
LRRSTQPAVASDPATYCISAFGSSCERLQNFF